MRAKRKRIRVFALDERLRAAQRGRDPRARRNAPGASIRIFMDYMRLFGARPTRRARL